MTPAVADIADLVKIMREQPEWAETLRSVLLSQELLELPEKMAQLTVRLEEFIAQQTETNRIVAEQLAQLTAQVSRLTEQLAQLTARLEEFIAEQREVNRVVAERLARLETDVAELKATTGRLETDVAELKATTGRLETDTAELKSDTAELKSDAADMRAILRRLEGTVGRLQGAELERHIHANIAGMVCTPLGIRHPRVLKSVVVSTVPELFNLLHPAQDDGRIDQTQFDRLMQTDIILSARTGNAQRIYVAIEISRTVYDEDLTRARERADILAAASGTQALALVIGYIIPPPQRRKAEELGVHLMETARLAAFGEDAD